MILSFVHFTILGMAAIPLIYYSLALFSAWQFFRSSHKTLPVQLSPLRSVISSPFADSIPMPMKISPVFAARTIRNTKLSFV